LRKSARTSQRQDAHQFRCWDAHQFRCRDAHQFKYFLSLTQHVAIKTFVQIIRVWNASQILKLGNIKSLWTYMDVEMLSSYCRKKINRNENIQYSIRDVSFQQKKQRFRNLKKFNDCHVLEWKEKYKRKFIIH